MKVESKELRRSRELLESMDPAMDGRRIELRRMEGLRDRLGEEALRDRSGDSVGSLFAAPTEE